MQNIISYSRIFLFCWETSRINKQVELDMTIFIFKQKQFPPHSESLENPELSLPRAGIHFNLCACNVLWDSPVIWHSVRWNQCYLEDGLSHKQNLTMLWHKAHHNPIIQGGIQGVKTLGIPLTPCSPGSPGPGAEGTLSQWLSAQTPAGHWTAAPSHGNVPAGRGHSLRGTQRTGQRHWGQEPQPKITLKAGGTALMLLLQGQVRALMTLQSTCESEHSVWQSGCWSQATKGKIKTQTCVLVALTSSWGMMTWVSPWKSLKTRNRPCLIHEKHKRKNTLFTDLVVSAF